MQDTYPDSHYDTLDAIALGLPLPAPVQWAAPAAPASTPAAPSAHEQALLYALAKQVPAMERGFTITTSYGDIVIETGRHADAIAAAVRRALEAQHKALARAAAKALRAAHAGAAA